MAYIKKSQQESIRELIRSIRWFEESANAWHEAIDKEMSASKCNSRSMTLVQDAQLAIKNAERAGLDPQIVVPRCVRLIEILGAEGEECSVF